MQLEDPAISLGGKWLHDHLSINVTREGLPGTSLTLPGKLRSRPFKLIEKAQLVLRAVVTMFGDLVTRYL